MEQVKLIKHTVKIDEYTEITLNIPETMSALELKGLLMRGQKIYNLAPIQEFTREPEEMKVIPFEVSTGKRQYNKSGKYTNKKLGINNKAKKVRQKHNWTPEAKLLEKKYRHLSPAAASLAMYTENKRINILPKRISDYRYKVKKGDYQ